MSIEIKALHCGTYWNPFRQEVTVTKTEQPDEFLVEAFQLKRGGLCWLPPEHEGPHDWEHLPIERVLLEKSIVKSTDYNQAT